MKNKFDFYEIVKVNSTRLSLRKINGLEGVIRGMSQNEDTGQWGYAVDIFNDEFGWDIMEYELIATGGKDDPARYKPVATVKVIVDPVTGEGRLKEDDGQ